MAYLKSDRNETTFFPPCIEDYVGATDPVRAYDAFVNALNFVELGIREVPGGNADEYNPRVLLKILIYGTSYGVRSSRHLERACHHNVSFMWLTGGIRPDFRTIGRFRRTHLDALKKVLKQCVRLCVKLELIDGNVLFVDGTGIRANAGVKRSWDIERIEKRIKKIDAEIDRIVDGTAEEDLAEEKRESLMVLREDLRDKERLKAAVAEFATTTGRKKLNTTDVDSTIMRTRQGTHPAHNAQTSADGKHGLVVSAEAVSDAADANHLKEDVDAATEVLSKHPSTVCADAGYYSLDDLAKIDEKTRVIVPSPRQVSSERHEDEKTAEEFGKDKFIYDEERDRYRCPAGQMLPLAGTNQDGKRQYRSSGKACRNCKYFGKCTTNVNGRRVTREAHEKLGETLAGVYKSPPGRAVYRLRQQIIEPVFGHWKQNLSVRQFLLRGRAGVNAELSLLSTGFNVVRMITILGGVQAFIRAVKTT